MINWKSAEEVVFHCMGGAGTMTDALDNGAVVDLGGAVLAGKNVVQIPATGHNFLAGAEPVLIGTTNYDGNHEILTLPDANSFTIEAPYVAENVNGHNMYCGFTRGRPFRLMDFDLHMDGASATAEDLAITLGSVKGSAFDTVLFAEDTDTLADMPYVANRPRTCQAGDVLVWSHTNTDANAWAITAHFEVAGR